VPPKKKVTLPEHVRNAVLADVALTYQRAMDADEDAKIRIYLATEQGLDTYELADELSISQTTASKYKIQGKQALERREEKRQRESGGGSAGEDPVRPGEREPVS